MTHQDPRVQQLPVDKLHTLHRKIIQAEPAHTAHDTPIIQRPPRGRFFWFEGRLDMGESGTAAPF